MSPYFEPAKRLYIFDFNERFALSERNELDDRLWLSRQVNVELRRLIGAQVKYIAELEKQLEPSVIAEIRAELEASAP